MKLKPNYFKHILQWGVLIAIVGTIVYAHLKEQTIDVEKYCPFGGLEALGTYLHNNSLACSMSLLQIVMGVALAVGVILFSKLFCGYVCPLGTVSEYVGKAGAKVHLHFAIPSGSIVDKMLRVVKYVLLFTVFYYTLSSSELFCKRFDPYYAMATGFKGEIVMWMVYISLSLFFIGSLFVNMFWCRYICPLGAASNIFKFTPLFIVMGVAMYVAESVLGIEGSWIWVLAATCVLSYIVEIWKMRSCVTPFLYIKRDEDSCNRCGLCEKKCPYNIPVKDLVKVKHVDCTMCGNCISSCAKGSLSVNGHRSLRWLPATLVVVLFATAVWVGNTYEIPTINEKWGTEEQMTSNLETFRMSGLTSIKCFGSSKAFSAKMQDVAGVYGVKTFVKSHTVEILYNPSEITTAQIEEAIFTPVIRKYSEPESDSLRVVVLGVEGLHDRMDVVNFGRVFEQSEGIYGFTSKFACPVEVTMYLDPTAEISESMLKKLIEQETIEVAFGEKTKEVPIAFVLKSFADGGIVAKQQFVEAMFEEVANMSGKFNDNSDKWGDNVAYPKAYYEIAYPMIEKMPIRMQVPYFKSFLSCTDGVTSIQFLLKDNVPTMRIEYVAAMWDDARIWKEIFNAQKWTLRFGDGTFKEDEPRLKFTEEGKTVADVEPAVVAAEAK